MPWQTRPRATAGAALCPGLQQCLRLLQVCGIKALGEPVVDGRQELVYLSALALPLPQPAQTQRRPQFQRLGLLAAGHSESLLKAGFCFLLWAPGSGLE